MTKRQIAKVVYDVLINELHRLEVFEKKIMNRQENEIHLVPSIIYARNYRWKIKGVIETVLE